MAGNFLGFDYQGQFSSVIIFREIKYMTKNKLIITYNHNLRILRRAFDPGFT